MPSLDEQLAVLKSVGIELNASWSIDNIIREYGSAKYFEERPYHAVLTWMGNARRCDQIIHQDTECIEGDGSYRDIAEDMQRLAGGALPLEDIHDQIGDTEAVLHFKLHGKFYEWTFEVIDDWVDGTVFSRFVELLAQQNTSKRFTFGNLRGQDCLIGCLTPEQLETLNRAAGFEVFTWLT